jgi:hypothetical protein
MARPAKKTKKPATKTKSTTKVTIAARKSSKKKTTKTIRYKSPLAKKLVPVKSIRFKKVRHPHDGQGIQFRVPSNWKETWGSEDNALFYPELPGMTGASPIGGKLFVRFRLEPVGHGNDGAAFSMLLSHRTADSQKVIEVEDGVFLLHFQDRHNREGYHAIDYFWFLAKPFPPRRVAVACFLFSGVAELFDGPNAPEAHIVALLEKELPKAVFDQEVLPIDPVKKRKKGR